MGAIYLLRHGQASFGSSNYDQLSALGHEQARVLGAALKARGVQPSVLVSGSMQRHKETAAGAMAELATGVPQSGSMSEHEHVGVNEFDHENVIEVAEPRYRDKLVMMSDMAASGDPRRAFQKFFQDAVARWVGGNHDDEYAEPWSVFKLRCVSALNDIVQLTPPKGNTLVFTSGGTISVICAHLLGLSDAQAFTINWTLANTGITKVLAGRDGLHLVSVNEHAHLEGQTPSLLTYR
jgi:broad specificity phosphatase PhoE